MNFKNFLFFATLTIIGCNYACSNDDDSIDSKSKPEYETVTDIEGNTYKTIQIGDQIWMAENLKTSTYNDGSPIPNITDDELWQNDTKGAYCWYDNDISNKAVNGALYNWYTISSGKLCPDGWHIPSDNEWRILLRNADATMLHGVNLNKTGWNYTYKTIADSLNFKGPLSGLRNWNWEPFIHMGETDYYWLDYEDSEKTAYAANIDSIACSWGTEMKNCGFSIRCIKNE